MFLEVHHHENPQPSFLVVISGIFLGFKNPTLFKGPKVCCVGIISRTFEGWFLYSPCSFPHGKLNMINKQNDTKRIVAFFQGGHVNGQSLGVK